MMSLKKMFLWFFILTIFAGGVSWAGISVSPSNQEVILKKDEVFKDFFTVYNESDDPIYLANSMRDWFILPENSEKGMKSESFLSIYPTYFYLPARGQADLFYEIKVPTYAVGSSVSMVSFTASAASGVNMRVSVSVGASVEGTEKINWDISNLKLNFAAPGTDSVTADLKIVNTGNVYVRPVGVLVLTASDKSECTFNFEEEKPVYPGIERSLFATGQSDQGKGCALKPGIYKAKVSLQSWKGYAPWSQSKEKKFKISLDEARNTQIIK